MAVRDITLGQYYPGESCIHRLDPRVKILCALVYLVSLFVVQSFSAFALCIVFLALVISLSKVPFKFISKGLKPIMLLIVFTMLINLFFTSTGDILVTLGPLKITKDGVYRACFMGLRLVLLVPLFVSAFRIAGDLAMAMEARCYHGGAGRTRMHQMKLGKSDAVAVIVTLVYLALVILSRQLTLF